MADLHEQWIRDAISASVEKARPSFDVMVAVRRRHRGHLLRAAVAGTAAVCAIAAVVVVAIQLARPAVHPPGSQPTRPASTAPGRLSFRGGGRPLTAGGGLLAWVYPDGRTSPIRGDFDGATVSAGRLLAWRFTGQGAGYYTMTLGGANGRLVLPADRNPRLSEIAALLSPDGSSLAYIRQDIASPTKVIDTLWVLDLATGRRTNLGPISDSAFGWRDASTILTGAPDGKSLVLVTVPSGNRSTFLSVSNPALVSAYERARPGAGLPASIGSDGMTGSGSSVRLAVWLAAADPHLTGGVTSPAEVVMADPRPVVTYAPRTPEALNLSFGPDGLVLLRTGAGDNPASWNTYVGTQAGERLSVPIPLGMDGALFNPAGNVIALQDAGTEVFVPTPAPACSHTRRCLHFTPVVWPQGQTIQAWLP